MPKVKSGRGARLPRPLNFKITKNLQRQSFSIGVGKLSIPTCGHARATVRNVVELGGVARYICRACFAHLLAVEVRVIAVDQVRRKLAELFRYFGPRVALGLGGVIEALAAMLAPIGEGGAI